MGGGGSMDIHLKIKVSAVIFRNGVHLFGFCLTVSWKKNKKNKNAVPFPETPETVTDLCNQLATERNGRSAFMSFVASFFLLGKQRKQLEVARF